MNERLRAHRLLRELDGKFGSARMAWVTGASPWSCRFALKQSSDRRKVFLHPPARKLSFIAQVFLPGESSVFLRGCRANVQEPIVLVEKSTQSCPDLVRSQVWAKKIFVSWFGSLIACAPHLRRLLYLP